jgi:hypothetical protein
MTTAILIRPHENFSLTITVIVKAKCRCSQEDRSGGSGGGGVRPRTSAFPGLGCIWNWNWNGILSALRYGADPPNNEFGSIWPRFIVTIRVKHKIRQHHLPQLLSTASQPTTGSTMASSATGLLCQPCSPTTHRTSLTDNTTFWQTRKIRKPCIQPRPHRTPEC